MKPYYADASVTLYHGDMREVLPVLSLTPHLLADCVVTDPPYGETSLVWDRWPSGWPSIVAGLANSMWCFGSMRMFLEHRGDFGGWTLSQDVVWEKHAGSGFAADRFRRVHEHALHWYGGPWDHVHHETPRYPSGRPNRGRAVLARGDIAHTGAVSRRGWEDDGTRQATSVLFAPSMHGRAIHPTEKPVGVLTPLIEYACPPGGLVLDPFAGSGSTGEAARLTGRRAVLVEADERYCEAIARRMSADVLPIGGVL
jgi:site-specific DNA-methyltransferase (adenine-specific)